MRINEKLENILSWIFVVIVTVFGYLLLSKLISSNLFWEILRFIFVVAGPYVFAGWIFIIFSQQVISAYKKDGINSALIAFFGPIGAVLLVFLGFKLYFINPFIVVIPLTIWFVGSLIRWIIKINRD